MCVALTINGEASIPIADLERMDNDNPHGIGVAYLDSAVGKIKIRKGLTLKDLAWIQADLPRPFLMHFRWATIGPKVPRLAHPFALGHDAFSPDLEQWCTAALIHNGGWGDWRKWILPDGVKDGDVSDTQVAAYVIGAGHPEVRRDVGWSNAIIKLGAWRGTPIALVTEHGTWQDVPGMKGVRASNLNWQTRARGVVTSYGSSDYHGYTGGAYGKYTPAVWKDGKMISPGMYESAGTAQPYKGATVANTTRPTPTTRQGSHSMYENWERDVTPVPSRRTPGIQIIRAAGQTMADKPCDVCRYYVCACPPPADGALMSGLVPVGVRSGDVKPHSYVAGRSGVAYSTEGVGGRLFNTSWGARNRAPAGASPCGVCTYFACVCGYSDGTKELIVSRRVSGLDGDPGAPIVAKATSEDASIVERVNRGTLPINVLEDLTPLDLTPLNPDAPAEVTEEAIAALKSARATTHQQARDVMRHMTHKEAKAKIARNRTERRAVRRKAQLAIDAIPKCPRATAEMILNLAEREIVTRGLSAPPRNDTSKSARLRSMHKRIEEAGTKVAPANDRGCTAGVCYCPGADACDTSKRLAALAEACSDAETDKRLAAMAEASGHVEIDEREEITYRTIGMRDPVIEAHATYLHEDMARVQRALTDGDYGKDDGAIMSFGEDEDTDEIATPRELDPEYARGVESWDMMGGEGG